MSKKTLPEIIEENKRILRAEYQRGFANGGEDMWKKILVEQFDKQWNKTKIEQLRKEIRSFWNYTIFSKEEADLIMNFHNLLVKYRDLEKEKEEKR